MCIHSLSYLASMSSFLCLQWPCSPSLALSPCSHPSLPTPASPYDCSTHPLSFPCSFCLILINTTLLSYHTSPLFIFLAPFIFSALLHCLSPVAGPPHQLCPGNRQPALCLIYHDQHRPTSLARSVGTAPKPQCSVRTCATARDIGTFPGACRIICCSTSAGEHERGTAARTARTRHVGVPAVTSTCADA